KTETGPLRYHVLSLVLAASLLCYLDSTAAPLPPKKMARIGFMAENDTDPRLSAARNFLQGMADLGWVAGTNPTIEYRYTGYRSDLARAAAEDLVRLGVDVIVTVGTVRTQAAQKATRSIPIVMAGTGDPVTSGFVKELARPGGNITGMSLLTPGLAGK